MDFTRRGVLGAFLVAPAATAIKLVVPSGAVAAEPEHDVRYVDDDFMVRVAIMDGDGFRMTEWQDVTNKTTGVFFPQDANNRSTGRGHLIEVPNLSDFMAVQPFEFRWELGLRWYPPDGDLKLAPGGNGFLEFGRG